MTDAELAVRLIDDHVLQNYRQVRVERGQTWAEMADQFDRDAQAPTLAGDRSLRLLAAWARSQDDGDPQRREGTVPAPAGPPPKRDTRQPPPRRTAAG